ncbi:MAG: hypothetical protein ABR910_08430 [Acidobacteriaceae bacterium]|jgi:ABC-type nickel/cobalt efflux system permease component RcnA
MTLDEIVRDYIRHYRDASRAEMRIFSEERSVDAAIQKAALCVWSNGKRHPHQRRIPKAVLQEAWGRLHAIRRNLARAVDFEVLHCLVDREIGCIRGIGALTVYDVAHRVGAYFGMAPTVVYLHAGTTIGAAVFGLKGNTIQRTMLPEAFAELTAAEIEDCLCIYKEQLRNTSVGWRSPESSRCRMTLKLLDF